MSNVKSIGFALDPNNVPSFLLDWEVTKLCNLDCRMSTTGLVEPLGNIRESESIISTLTTQLETGAMPIITCKKTICRCGFCAPKTESREEFMQLIKRHVPVDVFQKEC